MGRFNIMKIVHGGDIKGFSKKSGIDERGVHDFSSNINPLGIPDSVKDAYHQSLPVISKYPDAHAEELHKAIAQIHHLSTENVLSGNGSISLIDLVIRSLKPQRALLIEPCFNEYRRLLKLSGANIDHIVLKEEDGFQLPFEEIVNKLNGTDIFILGHPNNPTGTSLSKNQLLSIAEEASRKGKVILVDEAFIDWRLDDSVMEYVRIYPSIVVLRSLTKFYSLAGIRSGYACAHEEVINKMRFFQETWSCNALAQKMSLAALSDKEFQAKSIHWFREENDFMLEALKQIATIKVYPSKANFFLCKMIKPEITETFWQSMSRSGIYLRGADDFIGLDRSYFRVALKTREENCYFLEKLRALLKEQQGIDDRNIFSVHS